MLDKFDIELFHGKKCVINKDVCIVFNVKKRYCAFNKFDETLVCLHQCVSRQNLDQNNLKDERGDY